MQAKFVPGGFSFFFFFVSGCIWKSIGVGVHATQCACEMTMERCLAFKKLGFLEQQTTVSPLFFLKYSFRRAMLQLEFRESKSNPEESHFEQSQSMSEVARFGTLSWYNFLCTTSWP